MQAKLSWIALTVGLLGLAIPSPASAQATLDANCPGPRDATTFFSGDPGGNARFAQTFTAQAGGALTMAQAEITKTGTSANWIMSINEVDGSASPTNAALASTTILDSNVPNGATTITGSFANPATVVAGQQYSLVVTRPGSSDLWLGLRSGNVCPGQLFSSGSQTGTFFPLTNNDAVFAVFVGPTPTPTPPPPSNDGGVDSTPPDTTITKGPKDKTKKKTATFEFSSSEPGSSFECSLDGKLFACTSPVIEKVREGKHSFQVEAIDQAGNTDPTPATDTWKVKKKRKK